MPLENGPQAPNAASNEAERQKRTYTQPVLMVFGSVVKLTQLQSGSGADGGVAGFSRPA